MAVLSGSRLSDVPDRAIVISSAPMMSAQIAKVMEYRLGRIKRPSERSVESQRHVRRMGTNCLVVLGLAVTCCYRDSGDIGRRRSFDSRIRELPGHLRTLSNIAHLVSVPANLVLACAMGGSAQREFGAWGTIDVTLRKRIRIGTELQLTHVPYKRCRSIAAMGCYTSIAPTLDPQPSKSQT